MKRKSIICCILFICFTIMTGALAFAADDNKVTKEECMANVKEFAGLVKKKGFDAVKGIINNPEGKYVWKDSYIFCLDTKEGIMLAHPYLPEPMKGRSMLSFTDSNGKQYMKEIMDTANSNGDGWVTYMARKPGTSDVSLKESYVLKIPEANIIVGAGYYPDAK